MHGHGRHDILDTNRAGLNLIKRSEAFRSDWYKDVVGVYTIGYGITENALAGVNRRRVPGPITEPEAERYLIRALITTYEPAIEKHELDLNENQFSALASFVYNIGESQFDGSTMLRKLKAGDHFGAAKEFDRWVYAGARKYSGLVKRRAAERALFETSPIDADTGRVYELIAELKPMEPLPVSWVPVHLPSVPKSLALPRWLQ